MRLVNLYFLTVSGWMFSKPSVLRIVEIASKIHVKFTVVNDEVMSLKSILRNIINLHLKLC